MGRFETHWLAAETNLSALADLSGRWINLVHSRRPPRGIVLDMDSSVSPTHGEASNPASEVITLPRNWSIRRRSKSKPQRTPIRFTRRVPPWLPCSIHDKMLSIIPESG